MYNISAPYDTTNIKWPCTYVEQTVNRVGQDKRCLLAFLRVIYVYATASTMKTKIISQILAKPYDF